MPTTMTERYVLASTPGAVFARLSRPEVIERRSRLDSQLRSEVLAHEVDGDVIRIRTQASMPLDWLPTAVVVGGGLVVPGFQRREVWTLGGDELLGCTTLDIRGIEALAEGEIRLLADDTGSFAIARFTLSVPGPTVGQLVERALSQRVSAMTRLEIESLDGSAYRL